MDAGSAPKPKPSGTSIPGSHPGVGPVTPTAAVTRGTSGGTPSGGPTVGSPTTGAPAGPVATPGGAAPRGPATGAHGGVPLDLQRGETSRSLLTIAWSYPVWQRPARTGTVAGPGALPLAEAVAFIAGDDPRPLLVMRECDRCVGTDHALLYRDLDNEQTALLTRWFHCVKLPPNVLTAEHPLSNLFQRANNRDWAPHLFLCSRDGSNRTTFSGGQTQTEVWTAMFAAIERDYQGDARAIVKELRVVLSKLDKLDTREHEFKLRLAAESDTNGADSEKAKRWANELAAVQRERQGLLTKEKQLRAVSLKQATKPAPVAEAAADK
jgi:hypothetical protein